MHFLIIKEDMRSECFQHILLVNAAQEKRLINPHIPLPQRTDGPLMGRRIARGHQGCADRAFFLS